MTTVWALTGNNVQLGGDTSRRALFCRIEPLQEDPESRTDFKHADLTGWVRAERHRLAVAAVTILRAYAVAGLPRGELQPWGSYEAWSALIRQAIVWVGLTDPAGTREMARAADRTKDILRLLMDGIEEVDTDGLGLTAAELCERAGVPDRYPTLAAAVAEVCGAKPDARRLGYRLRAYHGRICQGRRLISAPARGGVQRWRTEPATVVIGGDGGDIPDPSRERPAVFPGDGIEPGNEKYEGLVECPPSQPSPPARLVQGVL